MIKHPAREKRGNILTCFGILIISMTVKCKVCGHINVNDSIYIQNEKGEPVFMAGSPYPPSFTCVKCKSKKIEPIDFHKETV